MDWLKGRREKSGWAGLQIHLGFNIIVLKLWNCAKIFVCGSVSSEFMLGD